MADPALDQELYGDVWRITYRAHDLRREEEASPVVGDVFTSVSSGFVDAGIRSPSEFRPSLVYNDNREGVSVLSRLLDELHRLGPGDEFWFVVAFVKQSGLQLLIQALDAAQRRGVKGRIITGTYLTFSEPMAFRTILRYPNIEARVYNADFSGLHAKSYFFIRRDVTTLLTGSSNLTQYALKNNMEWNLALSSTQHGSLIHDAKEAYERIWNSPETCALTPEFIELYEAEYKRNARAKVPSFAATTAGSVIEPNKMQEAALKGLAQARRDGEARALVISATGTGKTYLSALDVRQMTPAPRRVLFVVHRERIAAAAMKSFARVLGDAYTYGMYTGSTHDDEATCLFCTVQTLSRPSNLEKFEPDAFDYIVIDEVHRAGAASYRRIIDYLRPKFLLGMSATPERNDDFDVFALFNHVVAYEIRLSDALENHLVTPFHYFGVSSSGADEDQANQALAPDVLAARIADQSEKYGYSGPRLKGLVFCSSVGESEGVSDSLCGLGYRSLALSGSTSESDRERAMERLEQDEDDGALDFLVTVDIFNEGVDIPTVNQVILARPTESAIVFVQQLGRGLRTNPEKEYVTVIDFVANYGNNYNIPVALYGDRTYEKERLRRLISDGGDTISGPTTVQFDEIARDRVLESVNKATFNSVRFVGQAYRRLRQRLGRIPSLEDFRRWGEASPSLIFKCGTLGSYHAFLSRYEKDYDVSFSDAQIGFLTFVSKMLSDGKRPIDLLVLEDLLKGRVNKSACMRKLAAYDLLNGDEYAEVEQGDEVESSWRVLALEFFDKAVNKKYLPIAVRDGDSLIPSEPFAAACADPEFCRQIEEVVRYGLGTHRDSYAGRGAGGSRLCLGERYTRADACRLLNWKKDEHGTVNGYAFRTDDWLVFVTYRKSDEIAESVRYEDRFVSPRIFTWFSQSNRSLQSKDAQKLKAFDPSRQRIHLFVKRDDSEGQDHYYLGTMRFDPAEIREERRPGKGGAPAPILRVEFELEHEVAKDTYRYLVG